MFKSISIPAKKRKDFFKNRTVKEDDVSKAIEKFLDVFFKKEKKMFKNDMTTNIFGNSLIINTGNKIMANELVVKSRELMLVLKNKNLLFDKIIIK